MMKEKKKKKKKEKKLGERREIDVCFPSKKKKREREKLIFLQARLKDLDRNVATQYASYNP